MKDFDDLIGVFFKVLLFCFMLGILGNVLVFLLPILFIALIVFVVYKIFENLSYDDSKKTVSNPKVNGKIKTQPKNSDTQKKPENEIVAISLKTISGGYTGRTEKQPEKEIIFLGFEVPYRKALPEPKGINDSVKFDSSFF